MLQIYRTGLPGGGHEFEPGQRVVLFSSEHAWLCDAVAIPRHGTTTGVLHGTVEDGVLTDRNTGANSFIWKGDEDALAFHSWCWKRMGEPSTEAAATRAIGLHAWAVVATYDGQLFEHAEFRDHGYAWMLEDPDRSPRSRARIEAVLGRARSRAAPVAKHATVRDVVAAEQGWTGVTLRDGDHTPVHQVHHRVDVHSELDTASYPTLVWAMVEYVVPRLPSGDAMQALADYETAVIAAVERDAAAIVLMTTLGADQTQYLIQARDEAATRAAIEALPTPAGTKAVDFDNAQDPAWSNFFTEMDPRLHNR